MTYNFREVKKNEYGTYDYTYSKFIAKITDTSDFCNILNIMKDSKSLINLCKYNADIEDDEVYNYTIVSIELTLLESFYEEPHHIVTVYVVDSNGAED